ncbi:hypothetical protein RND81_04G048100 [Saponaria officinalis]|uniref:DUF4283 domain-containing protein n=1 Tax=Saponaria officinalis TaxID=3572 RepID=A0AAW1LH69_SAPOF
MGRPRKKPQPAQPAPVRRGRSKGDDDGDAPSSSPATLNDFIAQAFDSSAVSCPLHVLSSSDPVISMVHVDHGGSASLVVNEPSVPISVIEEVSAPIIPVVGEVSDPIITVVEEVPVASSPVMDPPVSSSIPNGEANPIVIPVVHRPTWMDRVANSPVGMELRLVSDTSKDGEVQDFVKKFWNHVEKPTVLYYKKGWFFFRFGKVEDLNVVLRGSTWSLGGHALILKHWSPQIVQELDTVSKVPVWVTLPNLDPIFWSEAALSKIGSKIGTPLYADPVTTNKERLSFARVMVEVDVKLGHLVSNCRVLKRHEKVVQNAQRQTMAAAEAATPVAEVIVVDSSADPEQPVSEAVQRQIVGVGEQQVTQPQARQIGSGPRQVVDKDGLTLVTGRKGRRVLPILNVENDNSVTVRLVEHDILHNYGFHSNGRIWVLWSCSSLRVTLVDAGDQWLHVRIEESGRPSYMVTFVYGMNDAAKRVSLWSFLCQVTVSLPWVVLGDFNCVRYHNERIRNSQPDCRAMEAFNDAVCNAGLEDISTRGCVFTWTNKQLSDRKWMRLDRVLVNCQWLLSFPSSYADALCAGVSDHSPLVVASADSTAPTHHQFRFLNCWADDSNFLPPLVNIAWSTDAYGCPMFRLITRLKKVRAGLQGLHRSTYSNISERVAEARGKLLECQTKIQLDPLNLELIEEEEEVLSRQFSKWLEVELSIMYQRAKIRDIKISDASTSYFHAKVATRRNSCNIGKVRDMLGVECQTFASISNAFISYYMELLGSAPAVKNFDASIMKAGPTLLDADEISLLAAVTDAEIQAALFSIDSTKSPGPDGFTSGFFKSAWPIIKYDFLKAVSHFVA